MEPEEKEERGSGRSQNVVHTLPRSMSSVPRFLTGPLERLDPTAGTTQLVVITRDAETAIALAEAVLRMSGPASIELLPVTTARRTGRVMAGRPVLAIAGAPGDIRDLVRSSQLKLDGVKTLVLAWADEILSGDSDEIEALEAIMGEVSKDSARVVVTSRSEGRVNAFAERYLRRAHRDLPPEDAETPPVAVQYVTVSPTSRATALRRLLDDLDPPSAAIVVCDDDAEAIASYTVKLLGYGPDATSLRVTRGEIVPSTHAVIFFDPPESRKELSAATDAGAVTIIVMAEPRELDELRRVSGGVVKPFALTAPGNAARDKDVAMRRELASALDAGVPTRELLALEPLLERYDGIEIAAAALKLLERERALRQSTVVEMRPQQPSPREARPAFDRGAPRGDRDRGDRGARPGRDRPRGGDSRPPRKFDDRPRRDRP